VAFTRTFARYRGALGPISLVRRSGRLRSDQSSESPRSLCSLVRLRLRSDARTSVLRSDPARPSLGPFTFRRRAPSFGPVHAVVV
jgi:hypothetical protein